MPGKRLTRRLQCDRRMMGGECAGQRTRAALETLAAIGIAACMGLAGGCSSNDKQWEQERELLETQRLAAERVLKETASTTRPVRPASHDEPDLHLIITVEVNGRTSTRSLDLRYMADSEERPALIDGVLFGGGAHLDSHSHGETVAIDGSKPEPFYEMLSISVGPFYLSGAIVTVEYLFHGPDSAEFKARFPVLWDVPLQTFYWPSGTVRAEIGAHDVQDAGLSAAEKE